MQLYCIPYAGGSSSAYHKWKAFLGSKVSIEVLELTGRGRRSKEPFFTNISDANSDFFENFLHSYKGGNYAIFGHSMGGLLAYELAHNIRQNNIQNPDHIFFSGSIPPQRKLDRCLHVLPDHEFMQAMIKLGGLPDEILKNDRFFQYFVSILKKDYKLLECYEYEPKAVLVTPISFIQGQKDPVTLDSDYELWQSLTSSYSEHLIIPNANHFFIHQSMEALLNHIKKILF